MCRYAWALCNVKQFCKLVNTDVRRTSTEAHVHAMQSMVSTYQCRPVANLRPANVMSARPLQSVNNASPARKSDVLNGCCGSMETCGMSAMGCKHSTAVTDNDSMRLSNIAIYINAGAKVRHRASACM